MNKVKAVINPMPGQSFNPTATAYKETLKKIVEEEVKEIEHNFKGTLKQHALAIAHKNDLDDDLEEEDEESEQSEAEIDLDVKGNKPV